MTEYLIQLHDENGSEGLTYLVSAAEPSAAIHIAWNQRQHVFGGPVEMPEWAAPEFLSTEITADMVETVKLNMLGQSIGISDEQARKMIASHEFLRRALLSYYTGGPCKRMDTADREYAYDAFAAAILEKDGWPCNYENDYSKEFMDAMTAAMAAGTIQYVEEN